jgi:arginase family enzyme
MPFTVFAGRVADRNPKGMRGALVLASAIADRFGKAVRTVGKAEPVVSGGWATQLELAREGLHRLASDLDERLASGELALTVMGRCAAALATLPVVARRHPEAAVVYFDAHGDCNAPADKDFAEDAYLGGMVLSGAAGEWETGLGVELDLKQVILVGSRDLDPPEREKIRAGRICLVEPGADLTGRLLAAIGGRPVYIHLDCDVLDAGLLPTEYQVAGGLSFAELHGVSTALSKLPLFGLEISEFEAARMASPAGSPDRLLDVIAPLVDAICGTAAGETR